MNIAFFVEKLFKTGADNDNTARYNEHVKEEKNMGVSVIAMLYQYVELASDDFMRSNKEYREKIDRLVEIENLAEERLNSEDAILFKEFDEIQSDLHSIMCDKYFEQGYALGLRTILEAKDVSYDFYKE